MEAGCGRQVAGIVPLAANGVPPIVEFREGGRVVGHIRPSLPREGQDGLGFVAELDIAGPLAKITAYRLPDGAPLAGSPIDLRPDNDTRPRREPPGRLLNWYDRDIHGVATADAQGMPPLIEFRSDGRIVATVRATLPCETPGLFAFSATMDVDAPECEIIAYHIADGRPLEPTARIRPSIRPLPAAVARVFGWYGATLGGFVAPDAGGEPPDIAFAVAGGPVEAVTAYRARPDLGGFTFDTRLSLGTAPVAVSIARAGDGRPFAESPLAMTPDVPPPPADRLAWDVAHRIAKPLTMPAAGEIALLAIGSASGALPPHMPHAMAVLREAGIAVCLVASVTRPIDLPPDLMETLAAALVREQAGGAFAAWAHALHLWPELHGARTLYLLDDTMVWPERPDRVRAMLDRVRASDADLVGLTASHQPGWHPEPCFMALKPRALASLALHRFVRGVRAGDDAYGPAFATAMAGGGMRIATLFPSHLATTPTRTGWRELLEDGFPFVARDIIDGAEDWRDRLAPAGFDVAALDRMVEIAREGPTEGESRGLLARPSQTWRDPSARVRIAFFGPWNHAGPAGDAARVMLAALGMAAADARFEPLVGSPERARPISPAVAIGDFTGPPDVAIIQADALMWLDDRQHALAAAAGRRILVLSGETMPPDTAALTIDRLWYAGDEPHAASAACLPDTTALPGWIVEQARNALAAPPAAPPPRPVEVDLAGAVRFDAVRGSSTVRIVPVAADGTIPAPGDVPDDRGLWLAFAPADALTTPAFAAIVQVRLGDRMDTAIAYADDVALTGTIPRNRLRLKPGFDATLLAAQDYIGWPLIVRASAYVALGGFDAAQGDCARDDLLLRAGGLGMAIVAMPVVLLAYPGEAPQMPPDRRRAMLAASPRFAGHMLAEGRAPGLLALARRFDPATMPAVTLLVSTDAGDDVAGLLDAVARTDWPLDRLRVILAAPGAATASRDRPFACRHLPCGTDHRTDRLNCLWRAAETDALVFLDAGLRPAGPGWLRALQTFALDEGVGGVGTRIVGRDGRGRHAGVGPVGGLAGALWAGAPADSPGYQGWALAQREWSMVSGAAFATRRSVLAATNGFDPAFGDALADYDLCLRLRSLGLRIVCTPDAEMRGDPRDATTDPAETARFRGRWQAWLDADPAFHPGLSRDGRDPAPTATTICPGAAAP